MVARTIFVLLALLLPQVAAAKPWRAVMAPGELSEEHAIAEDDCDNCHMPFKGIPDAKCFNCHAPIKKRIESGKGFHAAVKDRACIKCHTDHRGRTQPQTKGEALESFSHDQTTFPLDGAHQKVACKICHAKPLEKLSSTCVGCHKDPHAGELGATCRPCHASAIGWKNELKTKEAHTVRMDGGHSKTTCKDCHAKGENLASKVDCDSCHEAQHGDTGAACSLCHQVAAFAPAKHDHSGCTCKFPGIHQTFDCLGCHVNWKFQGTPTLCSQCHAKIQKHEPLGECSLCHSPFSWKKKEFFDHNKRSSFKIEGEHLRVDCSRCHLKKGEFRGAPKTCEGCHAERGEKAHGDFGACAKCHTIEGWKKTKFDHASTGFPLTGRHASLNCRNCHADKVKAGKKTASFALPSIALIASQFSQHAGDQKACVNCHADPHGGSARGECSSCHGTEVWKPSTFDRARHAATKLPLRGKHEALECSQCHLDAQLAGLPVECNACHFDPHRNKLGNACAGCHSESGFKPVPGFDHAKTGYTLIGPHARTGCERCHDGPRGRALAQAVEAPVCSTCHPPAHGRELGSDCTQCHALEPDTKEQPARFDRARGMVFFDHAKTGFPLERRHRVLACRSCHPASGPAPEPRCAGCHLDPHSGQLGESCEECHRADRFRLARFDHDRAGWPLRGRHFVTPCASCHTSQRWVGLTTDCFDCHASDAARARMILPEQHELRPVDCRDCHMSSSWTWRM